MGGMRTRIIALGAVWLAASFAVAAHAGEMPIGAVCRQGLPSPCVTRVGASLRSEGSGEPLSGRKLSFVSDGVLICSSLTNESGTASCFGVAPSGVTLSTAGYRVMFEGDGRYAAASALSTRAAAQSP